MADEDNRIEQVTPAFNPKPRTPAVVAVAVGLLCSSGVASIFAPLDAPWSTMIPAVLCGIGTALGAYYGVKSNGVQNP